MSIIATEDIHVVLVYDGRMRMPGTRSSFRVQRLHQVPSAILNAVPVEVINSVVPIITSKYVDAAIMHNCGVTISWRWWLCVPERRKLAPRIGLEIEAVEVITPVRSIVPTEDVEVVLEGDGGMQRTWAWWMHFVA